MPTTIFSLTPKILEILKPVAEYTLENFLKQKITFIKDAPSDYTKIITAVDKYNDDHLREELSKLLPEAGIISEENRSVNIDKEFVWTIDPIDGTFNYNKQIPVFGIIIGLWRNKTPELVVLAYPQLDEYVVLSLDNGIFLNDQKVTKYDETLTDIFYADVSKDIIERQKLEKEIFDVTGTSPTRVYSSAYITRLLALGLCNRVVLKNVAIWDVAGLILTAKIRGLRYKVYPETDWFNKDQIFEYNKKIVIGEEFFEDENLKLKSF